MNHGSDNMQQGLCAPHFEGHPFQLAVPSWQLALAVALI
jgi:hypothetical protein